MGLAVFVILPHLFTALFADLSFLLHIGSELGTTLARGGPVPADFGLADRQVCIHTMNITYMLPLVKGVTSWMVTLYPCSI